MKNNLVFAFQHLDHFDAPDVLAHKQRQTLKGVIIH